MLCKSMKIFRVTIAYNKKVIVGEIDGEDNVEEVMEKRLKFVFVCLKIIILLSKLR